MARPSVAHERRIQILQAALDTIAERGISGTTLDKIADTAGMSRGHVRHFAGNRDRLLVDAARHFYSGDTDSSSILPPTASTLDEAVEYLFGQEFTESSSENAIALGFVELARTSPDVAAVLEEAYSTTRTDLAAFIGTAKPALAESDLEWAAEGLLAIALGNVFLGDFNAEPGHTTRTHRAALAFLAAL